MGIINQKTAQEIWKCHREIEVAAGLLDDMEKIIKAHPFDPNARKLKDAFGRGQDLQLGIPSGENSHRLFNVSPNLAVSIIKAHISDQKRRLCEFNEIARIELEQETP